MKLENIGFYTLSDERARSASASSPLQRCEMLLTDRCNFKCPYCRKTGITDIAFEQAKATVQLWHDNGIRNMRFSGGEPTLWSKLMELVEFATRPSHVKKVALSTNGSADPSLYRDLVGAGVNDFSISLDACCASTQQKMAGGVSAYQRVIDNIAQIAERAYVTLGVVLTPANLSEVEGIVKFALGTKVADIRLISAAQWDKPMHFDIPQEALQRFPILRYRINHFAVGRNVRGIQDTDTHKCPLVLDDIAVMDGKHYPCIIYLRERGQAIGQVSKDMRLERQAWCERTDTHTDPICRKNCLDVCIDYNNQYESLHIHHT